MPPGATRSNKNEVKKESVQPGDATLMDFHHLNGLSDLIKRSLFTIQSICSNHSLNSSSLDEPLYHNSKERKKSIFNNPDYVNETRTIIAAAKQIIANVASPDDFITEAAFAVTHSVFPSSPHI